MKGNLRVNRCFQFVWGTIQNCSFFKHLTPEWEPHRYDLLFKSPFVKIVLTSTFYRCMVDQRVLSRLRIYEWSLLAKISFNETKYPWTLFWAHETMRILRFELRRSLYPNVLPLSVFRAKTIEARQTRKVGVLGQVDPHAKEIFPTSSLSSVNQTRQD